MARYVSFRDFDWLLLTFVFIICGLGVFETTVLPNTRSLPEHILNSFIGLRVA